MKFCRKCKQEMRFLESCNGSYYICSKCSNIDYPTSNYREKLGTYSDEEIDKVVIRGRD